MMDGCRYCGEEHGETEPCWAQREAERRSVDPAAHVHPSVRLGRNVRVGVGTVIAEGAVLEDDVTVWHHVNILPGARLKKGSMVAFACQIEAGVVIGERTRIQPYAAPGSGSVIGDDVYFGPYSCTANSPFPPGKRLVGGTVGDGAVLGMGVYVLPGLSIGERAVVGTGSLVTQDVPAEEVWFGHPATFRMTRAKYDAKREAFESGRSDYGSTAALLRERVR